VNLFDIGFQNLRKYAVQVNILIFQGCRPIYLALSDLHNLSVSLADKLGYPREMIDHSKARDRALRRFKNIGEE